VKLLTRSVLASVVLLLFVGFSANAAQADPSPKAQCDPASQAQITGVLSADGHEATYTVGNARPLCEPVAIGLAVYVKDADDFVVPQTLFASATGTITSGMKVLSQTLPQGGTAPHCFTQMDAFTGPVLSHITDTEQYGPRLLDFKFGKTPSCVESVSVQATTTTTSTTSTTTSTTSTTVPSTTTTAGVAGTSVEQTAPPTTVGAQVAGMTLPRTGSRDTALLVALAGMLLFAGGALMAWANRPLPL
jgi:LPXTG-motif cell wall-anchored protein